jgi:predicted Zn-dependent protease
VIEAQSVIEDGLATAERLGADGCIVLVDETSHADVRFAVNTTTTNGVRRDRTVTVIVLTATGGGGGAGSAGGGSAGSEHVGGSAGAGPSVGVSRRSGVVDVEQMVSAALTDARGAQPAEDAFTLVDGMTAARAAASAQAYGQGPLETDLSVLGGVLSGLGAAFERARRDGLVLAGFAEYGISTLYMGSSTGVRLSHSQPTGAFNLVGRSEDGLRSAWTGAGTADMGSLSFDDMIEEIWRRLDWARRTIALDAGRYEVILPPTAVADLMGSLTFYGLGGQDAEDGRTVFSAPGGGTRVGEQLSSIPFTLYSDPAEVGIECLPFAAVGASSSDESVFDNGFPLAHTDWIRDGQLSHLRHHRAGAARSGVDPTPYIDNLVLRADSGAAGGGTVDDMVARTERGLLLTCLWYIREVDPATLLLTGLTRDGVYVIEDGAVVGAANNFRFNESPVDLLARTTEVGTPVRALGRELGEYLNRAIMPALRVPDFNMSSVSQAS